MTNEKIVMVFKAFSDESRAEILGLLKAGEMCGNSLLEKMEISQSTLSHHMKILCESGVVAGRREGKWTYYSISKEGGEEARRLLDMVLDVKTAQASAKTATPKKTAARKKPAAKKPALQKPAAVTEKPEETSREPRKMQRKQLDSWLL